jgi:replicative DNA helicase
MNAIESEWQQARVRLRTTGMVSIRDAAELMYQNALDGGKHLIPSTFVDLDKMLSGGFRPGRTYYVAADSGMGKTTLTVSLARNIAYRLTRQGRKIKVLIFSFEMSKEEITEWIVAGAMRYPASQFWRMPREEPAIREKFRQWTGWAASLPIEIVDASTTPPAEMRLYIEELQRSGYEVIWFVDHIQRAATGDPKLDASDKEYARVSLLAQQYKNLAKDTNTPGIVLSQLNRNHAHRNDSRPTASDIRGSGRIREEADVVLALWRDTSDDADDFTRMTTEVIPLKNRQGDPQQKV